MLRGPRQLRSDLNSMLGDGCAFSVMTGVGESYVAAFALALGFGDIAAGLITTVPMLAGSALQLVTPAAVGWLGSHKRWVVLCAVLQAATFAPLAWGALAGALSPVLLFATISLYWALGMATGPAWNTWVGVLVPVRLRARFFARRAVWSQVSILTGLALGGVLLRRGDEAGKAIEAFAAIFLIALGARVVSAGFLARQSEPTPVPIGETRVSPRAIGEHLRQGGHGPLLVYMVVFQLSVWIAAPFFTPYMLGVLELDYVAFATLTGSAFVARIVALPFLGRMARVWGTRRLLWIGSSGIVTLPVLWLVSNHFAWLLVLQLGSGVVWGTYELAALLAFFEYIPVQSRTSVLTVYNLANAAALAGGSLVGALLLDAMSGSAGIYAGLFALSTGARLTSLLLLRRVVDVTPSESRAVPLRTLSLRPSSGSIQRPVLVGLHGDATSAVEGRGDSHSE